MQYQFQFRRYHLPFRAPVRTAHGPWAEREGVLVRLENATGRVGYGEAAPIPWFGSETVDEIEAACGELGANVDDTRLDTVPARLGCLRNALNVAREDREDGKVAPKQAHLAVAAMLPAGRAVLAQIASRAEAGFRVFKWKVGVGDLADELGLLDDVCAALPDGAKLRLDANGGWDRRQAERWLERCAERPVEFVEQPAFAQASEGAARMSKTEDLLRGLAEDFPTPIALDESVSGDADVARWLELGWQGVFVVKPSLLGNVPATLARLAKAKASVVFSSALETRLGAQAALRTAFDWSGAPRALGFGVWPLFADGRFDGPYAGPFLHADDVERINPEAVWNALS
ncbi:MAG: o-succinylbenzoate synthase [Opitutaceae bacterium]